MALPTDIQQRVNYWLNGPFDEDTKQHVRALSQKDLIDAFFCDLSFGTGGMRNLMGVGTNRLNNYTIRFATQGLANYLLKNKSSPSVVIGFDSRHHSQEFAEEAAKVLAGNSIHVHLIPELRPTPYISFACRAKKADAAIMITASHNPAAYNGYKVYWSDGAQVVHPHDTEIVKEAQAIKELSQVKLSHLADPLIQKVDLSLDNDYISAIGPLQRFAKENKQHGPELKIAYTSLHGTGITMVPKALQDWGFPTIAYVEKQIIPDPDFPTVTFPNPEYKEALQLGIDLLQSTSSDILLATDPDADRIGVVAMHQGKPVIINGNEMAAICMEYICEAGSLPPKGAFVTTIVSTELLKAIANNYHQSLFEVLTGFKYIGEKIHEWEMQKDSYQFLFGAEESYGYLLGTHARDKDAIVISCLIAEIALHSKLQGQTLIDRLHNIHEKYGFYKEKQISIDFPPGKDGMLKMTSMMEHLRKKPFAEAISIDDYQTQISLDVKTRLEKKLTLPISDVLVYRLADKSRIVIRPSGTEPKLKIYASVFSENEKECDEKLDKLVTFCKTLLS